MNDTERGEPKWSNKTLSGGEVSGMFSIAAP